MQAHSAEGAHHRRARPAPRRRGRAAAALRLLRTWAERRERRQHTRAAGRRCTAAGSRPGEPLAAAGEAGRAGKCSAAPRAVPGRTTQPMCTQRCNSRFAEPQQESQHKKVEGEASRLAGPKATLRPRRPNQPHKPKLRPRLSRKQKRDSVKAKGRKREGRGRLLKPRGAPHVFAGPQRDLLGKALERGDPGAHSAPHSIQHILHYSAAAGLCVQRNGV